MNRFILGVLWAGAALAADPFLTDLYDHLHDSPLQEKFRKIAPMPFGVVFLPWKGITEQEMRGQFRLMKQLGFHNLKQTSPTPDWPMERTMQIALEEGVVPFWYGEGGWAPITNELLDKLGIARNTPIDAIRKNPKMLAYQLDVLRKGIKEGTLETAIRADQGEGGKGGFTFVPDPLLRPADAAPFQRWLKQNYKSPAAIADAWNQYEVGFESTPVKTWDDVDRLVARIAAMPDALHGYGREYGRVRDVLRYKADYHTAEVQRRIDESRRLSGNPFAPTRTGGEMGLFLPFAWRATKMEDLAETQTNAGSFYPSIHFAWHYGEVNYEVARPIYMQSAFAHDLFKGGWSATWESTGGPQQFTGAKGWDAKEAGSTAGFTVNAGTMTQLLLTYLAAGFRGAGIWTWNYRPAGFEAGEYALLDRNLRPGARAIRTGKIAQAAERLRDELWQAHKEPQVGVLVNWDSDAIWAAISVRGRDHFKHYPMQARVGVSRALINGNIPFEYVTVKDLTAGLGPRYKAIYLPAQIAISNELLVLLEAYVRQGGRLVLDSPGAAYDEHGKVLRTAKGTAFERIFGASLSDLQYSNNVPRRLAGLALHGFISELTPTAARVTARFQTGEPAVTENRLEKGTAVLLAWDASYALFTPGSTALEEQLRSRLGATAPYSCKGAIVYRIAAPAADHYFFINDGPATRVQLTTAWTYRSAEDPLTGASVPIGSYDLEPYSGRWIRLLKTR